MQIIIAPSKRMTMHRPFPGEIPVSSPQLLKEAEVIVEVIRHTADIAELMHISQSLGTQVALKYKVWGAEKAPSIFAYIGDVYKGFFADTLSTDDLLWVQRHMFIMSGLYGALRPMDEISPYRLEMKAKIRVNGKKDIYDFWGDKVARLVDEWTTDGLICNLSSDEYARVVTRYTKNSVITPVFIDKKLDGSIGTVPIYSKMMRGVLARWMIDHRIDSPGRLRDFTAQGYSYDQIRSTIDGPVFYRDTPRPIRF